MLTSASGALACRLGSCSCHLTSDTLSRYITIIKMDASLGVQLSKRFTHDAYRRILRCGAEEGADLLGRLPAWPRPHLNAVVGSKLTP